MTKTRISNPFEKIDRETEWSAAATVLVDWGNQIIRDLQLDLGPAKVEKIGVDGKRPDGLIYKNPRSNQVLAIVEFKTPPFDPFDEDNLIGPAMRKASKRGVPYFATSNFKELIWFGTKEALDPTLLEEEKIKGKYTLSTIEDLDTLEQSNIQRSIKKGLAEFLKDLYEVSSEKKHIPRLPTDEFLIYRLQEKVKALTPHYETIIREQAENDPKFRRKLSKWFGDQNWSFAGQDEDYEKAARQTAYLLINKILFYIVLQSQRERDLDPLDIPKSLTKGSRLQKELQSFFDEVLAIDYETIYSTDFIDQIAFPDNDIVVYQVKELIKALNEYDFSELGYDVLGRIFERLIPPKERNILGQYFTDPDIVDLILRFALKHEDDKVFDPGCGAGTFLVRAYQHKKLMNKTLTHEKIIPTLWGNDIAKFPAHLATINLAIADLSSSENYPRIVKKDFFEWLPGKITLPESSRKVFLKSLGKDEKEEIIPKHFDCIVGNPPYTRQEEITSISKKDREYKENLIARALEDETGKKTANISKRAGLHAYFFVHGTKFLKDGGRFGFIVSNSWLDVDYGKGLQEHFLKNYKVKAVIGSKVERWFEQADVNTCIVLLEKRSAAKDKKERDENLVRFVYLKKPLRHFIPPLESLWEKRLERRKAIDNLFDAIFAQDRFYENEDFRVFTKKQKELWEEGFDTKTQKYEGSKWGRYIRAPEIFFKILEKGEDKLVPLKEVADVRRGFTTGANEFFYLTEEEIEKRKIEKEFWIHEESGKLVPNYVIKSPRECKSIVVKPENLKYRVLMIHKDRDQLKRTNVLKYIKWGESKGFHKRPTGASRKNWWDLGTRRAARINANYLMNDVGRTFIGNYWASDDFQEIHTDKFVEPFLNSTLFWLFQNIEGRTSFGGGLLKLQTYEFEHLPVIICDSKVKKVFGELSSREFGSIFEELGARSPQEVSLEKVKPDRRELDKIVMGEILGLTNEEQLEVYQAVVDLVGSRLRKAKSIQKTKKTRGGLDLDLMVETIMKRIGTPTLGSFYKRRVLSKKNLREVDLPEKAEPLEVKKTLLGFRLFSGKNSIDCVSKEEAEYLKIFVEADWENVKIPKDLEIIKKLLPNLKKIFQKIEESLEYYTDGILDERLKNQIKTLIWQAVSNS